MPLYAYRCRSCRKEHEAIQKFSDPPLAKCPSCGGKLIKSITSSAFHLKGGGWYKDGYASIKEKPSAPSGETAKKEEPKKEETKKSEAPKK